MNSVLRYLELKAKSKTGLSPGVFIFGSVAAFAVFVTAVFLLFAAFIWLAGRYDPLTAALMLAAGFFILTVVAAVSCAVAQRRTAEQARVALAARSSSATAWADPRYLTMGLQIGRSLGWKRILPLAAVGILAAGLAKEWIGRSSASSEEDDDEG
jgi:hypothetical protein